MSSLDLASLSDDALLALIRKSGEAASCPALEELLHRYSEGIIRMAYLSTRDQALSLDCAQEALIAVHKSLSGFRGESKFSTWVYTVAKRTIWKSVRKHRKYQQHTSGLEVEALEKGKVQVNEEAVQTQEQLLIGKEEQHKILDSIDSLPPKQREAVLLFYYQDCSHEQIAERLGCAANTVKAHLFKARATLAKKLGM